MRSRLTLSYSGSPREHAMHHGSVCGVSHSLPGQFTKHFITLFVSWTGRHRPSASTCRSAVLLATMTHILFTVRSTRLNVFRFHARPSGLKTLGHWYDLCGGASGYSPSDVTFVLRTTPSLCSFLNFGPGANFSKKDAFFFSPKKGG